MTQVPVPDVVGKMESVAIQEISEKGLIPVVDGRVYSPQPQGAVFSQSPAAGAMVNQGTMVHIIVSKGQQKVTVPNVASMDLNAAISTIQGAGLVATVGGHEDSQQAKDTVTKQNPVAGALVDPGSTVTLWLSNGPAGQPIKPKDIHVVAGDKDPIKIKPQNDPKIVGPGPGWDPNNPLRNQKTNVKTVSKVSPKTVRKTTPKANTKTPR